MKLKNLTPIAAAVALCVGSLVATTQAQAGVSGSIGVSNFYLWRGADASSGSAQVFGEAKYSHESGAYIAAWLSNWAATDPATGMYVSSNENNFYAGYAMKAAGIDLDFSYWNITYPTVAHATGLTIFNTNATEFVVGASMGEFSGSLVLDIDPDHDDKYKYLSVGYSKDKYSATLGKWMGSEGKVPTYAHLTVGYDVADELTFTVNKAFGGADGEAVNKELLLNIAWSKSFEPK